MSNIIVLRTHKIRNVDKDVCTVEQKIAYNMAFSDYDVVKRTMKNYGRAIGLSVAYKLRDGHIKTMLESGTQYNMDAVFCAYNAGIEEYCNRNFEILGSYEEIGETFPIQYAQC